jgi:hypothetical protein
MRGQVDHNNAPPIPVEYIQTEPVGVVMKRPPKPFNTTVDGVPPESEEPKTVSFKEFPKLNVGGIGI